MHENCSLTAFLRSIIQHRLQIWFSKLQMGTLYLVHLIMWSPNIFCSLLIPSTPPNSQVLRRIFKYSAQFSSTPPNWIIPDLLKLFSTRCTNIKSYTKARLPWQTPTQNCTRSPWMKFSLPCKLGIGELHSRAPRAVSFKFTEVESQLLLASQARLRRSWLSTSANLMLSRSSSPRFSVGLNIKSYWDGGSTWI